MPITIIPTSDPNDPLHRIGTLLQEADRQQNAGQFGDAEEVTLTARVSSPGPTPKGKVSFKVGGIGIGSALLNNGVARLTTKNLPLGTLSITATYEGDTLSLKSISTVLTQVVDAP